MLQASDIQVLSKVADIGSVNRACTVLNMSQSTLSKLIQRIEQRLGATLFERSGRGMVATPVCTFIIESGAGLEAQIEKIERQARLIADGKTGVINLGVGPIVEDLMLGAVLGIYTRALPGISLDIRTDTEARLLDSLARDELDVIVGPFDEAVRKRGFDIRQLVSQKIVFAVRRGHKLAKQTGVQLSDIRQYPGALPHVPASIERQLAGIKPDAGLSQRQSIRCEHYPTLKQVTIATDMIVSGPEVLFHKELKARDLVKLDFNPGLIWRCGLVAKRESLYAKPIGILADTFESVCGDLR